MLSDETVRRVDHTVTRAQAEARAPSIVVAVVRDGRLAHVSAAGDRPEPDADTQYRIGSITKSLTAVLVLALRDEGRLGLDDRLDDHLPDTGAGAIRIRQLLGHVSGLQREPDGPWWERSAGRPVPQLLAGVSPAKLAHPPHRRYHYSNLAYGLLGAVLERLSGRPWADLVTGRVLMPLGMTRTTYQAQEPFARGYVLHPWYGTLHEEPRHDAAAMAPAGQLWSTAADLATWAAFLIKPDPAVLAESSVTEMTMPMAIADPDAWTQGYGLGLALWRRGERIFLGHTGSMPGYLAMLAVHRPSGTGVVAFANTYTMLSPGISGLGLSILETVLEGEPAPLPAPWLPGTLPSAEIRPLCGRWWWMGREFEARWVDASAELEITPSHSQVEPWRFVVEGPDRWRCRSGDNAGEVLLVCRDETGTVTALDIATFRFTRDPWPPG